MSEGMALSKAVEITDNVCIINISFGIRESKKKQLEKEKGRRIGDIVMDKLAADRQLEIIVPREKVIVRKKTG
jgi:hypothetical protein